MLVIDEGADNDAGSEGHEDREHANSPAPANPLDDAVDNETRHPGCDEHASCFAPNGLGSFYKRHPPLGSHAGARVVPSPYGRFPLPNDPYNFIPCTEALSLPPLHDSDPKGTWAALFDPNPKHWSWGGSAPDPDHVSDDPYAGRGIYLCGYLDLPLDYLNDSDARIVRLAVAKFQVSGLARIDSPAGSRSTLAGAKSERTIVIEPGGPGVSGTLQVWGAAEAVTKRFSDGRFDVLGWDPRGVNASLPSAACFPHNADRDRWSLLRGQYRETSEQERQLEIADAMNSATFYACRQRLGDFGRFVSTASVARDLEEIRKALDEEQLTAYFVSYGTGIGQTYANIFPNRVGRMILDGPEYVKDHRQLGGWGWTSLDNVTDGWRDGFLGECVKAGRQNCALARPSETLEELEARMGTLLESILARPAPGYTESNGPSLVTYPGLVLAIYISLYDPTTWPATAQMLYELEAGNSTLAATSLDRQWQYKPSLSCPAEKHSSDELISLVICADAYDAPEEGLAWWDQLWANMTDRSWISGNSRFLNVLPCRHFTTYWSSAAEVYRGDLNHSLRNPVLLIASTYDPATPLRNGRRLLEEMGQNARMVVHHGYGHTSRVHPSSCTDSVGRAYILNGTLPEERETNCYADEKPYRM
ncbi:alpha/beta-hydrolase [Hyaloscypha bicolor E]|uniref:Alpha/beta-hydrolase n=1 Tax=Hyaloscypha bicolor E TaxID=1095630 RepID=A0A2J6TNK9_9HELO|nr:alpha/beta-hydrolase [Hyaloscypha bicolor E]PMD64602.1 alpha/beta-hydrolase [Hyaloscypha bicolor E]